MIEYKWTKPSIEAYQKLLKSAGWTSIISVSDEMLLLAIDKSWKWVTAFDSDKLIGIGRIISDGAMYALICDMIVLPEYQKQGIGSSMVKMLKDKCTENGIQRIWLFAAPGRSDFYLRNGFEIRPEDAPGMQMEIC